MIHWNKHSLQFAEEVMTKEVYEVHVGRINSHDNEMSLIQTRVSSES
jgi:hypothetical protein